MHFLLQVISLNPYSLAAYDVSITLQICCHVREISSRNSSSITDLGSGIAAVVVIFSVLDLNKGNTLIDVYGIAPTVEKSSLNATGIVRFSTSPSVDGGISFGRQVEIVAFSLEKSIVFALDVEAQLFSCQLLKATNCERSGVLAPGQLAFLSVVLNILDGVTDNLTLSIATDRDDAVGISDLLYVRNVVASGFLRLAVSCR